MSAPYNNKSIEEIRSMLLIGFQKEWNNKLRILPKSFIKVLSAIMAGIFIICYKQIGWLLLQIFPDTAYWGEINVLTTKVRPLVKWGILVGLGEPRAASQWCGFINVQVTTLNTKLNDGTQLKSDTTGKIYITTKPKTLEKETEQIEVVCTESGTQGNLDEGEILKFVNPLGNVAKEAMVKSIEKIAHDEETETEYRHRVVNRWRMQPQGGALADYRIWGQEVPGVLNIYPYNDAASPAGVLLFVSGLPPTYPDRIPSDSLLKAVGKSCTYNPETGMATRKPMTAIIDPKGNESYENVKPVKIIIFDIYIEGLKDIPALDFKEAVLAPIQDYFLSRQPYIRGLSNDNNKTDIVSKNNVTSVVDQATIPLKAEFERVEMRFAAKETESEFESIISSYPLGMGELCKLGCLYIDNKLFFNGDYSLTK